MTVRVLQVLGRSAGGIARHVAGITAALDRDSGLEIDIAGPPDLPVRMPKPVIPLEIPDGIVGHSQPIRELRDLMKSGEYQVVHAHGLRAGIDAGRAAKKSATVIVTVHNLVRPEVAGKLKATVQKPAERLVVRLADQILAVSRDIADDLVAWAPKDVKGKIEVMHLGIGTAPRPSHSPDVVRAGLGVESDDALIVTASRLSEQKALHVMLAAVARTDATLAILGQGPLESSLKELAGSLGIEERVHFLGFRDDVSSFIAASDVFCLSSVWEGVPLGAMEAVQLGTSVVATDVGGTSELIEDGVSGRLVPPNDPAALAAALTEVLSSPDTRARYVEAARRSLSENFDTNRMLDRLRELYRSAAE